MADKTQGIKGTFADNAGINYAFSAPAATTLARGAFVELTANDLEVDAVATLGTTLFVGDVIAGPGITTVAGKVTVRTRFRKIVAGVAGATITAPGPVYLDADGKYISIPPVTVVPALADVAAVKTYLDILVPELTLQPAVVGMALEAAVSEDDPITVGIF